MNEPNLAAMGGAPAGYDAAAYGRDFKRFHAFARAAAPDMLILGPGSVGETADEPDGSGRGRIEPEDAQPADRVAARRGRCILLSPLRSAFAALRRNGRADHARRRALGGVAAGAPTRTLAFYRTLRDAFAPGKPLWLTETADAACGGNPWARTFLDTFRYLDQLGRLAKQGVEVVAHNTLVASDYGLLDDVTLTPKPNYWGALLWRTLMDARVLDPASRSKAGSTSMPTACAARPAASRCSPSTTTEPPRDC